MRWLTFRDHYCITMVLFQIVYYTSFSFLLSSSPYPSTIPGGPIKQGAEHLGRGGLAERERHVRGGRVCGRRRQRQDHAVHAHRQRQQGRHWRCAAY